MKSNHAIVLGGGCAGLLASKVLAKHFDRVTLVEQGEGTQRIPQAVHLHVLLKRGQDLFEQIFPGILHDLKQRCPSIDWAKHSEWHGYFGKYPQYESGLNTLMFSRAFLDCIMNEHIKRTPNIIVLRGQGSVIFDNKERRACGVVVKKQQDIRLFADRIIDARGRRSMILKELGNAGFETPPFKHRASFLSYASCVFAISKHEVERRQCYLQVRAGFCEQGFVVSPIEDDRLMVTIIGLKTQPPKTMHEFKEIISTLIVPYMPCLSDAQVAGDMHVFRNFSSRRCHFGAIKMPKGLLVIGDATCIINPVYGQGMTMAAEQAALLDDFCRQKRSNFEQSFQRAVDQSTLFPWLMAEIEDCRGEKAPLQKKLLQSYVDRILRGAIADRALHNAFMRTLHMLDSPYSLFYPSIFFRALRS